MERAVIFSYTVFLIVDDIYTSIFSSVYAKAHISSWNWDQ